MEKFLHAGNQEEAALSLELEGSFPESPLGFARVPTSEALSEVEHPG